MAIRELIRRDKTPGRFDVISKPEELVADPILEARADLVSSLNDLLFGNHVHYNKKPGLSFKGVLEEKMRAVFESREKYLDAWGALQPTLAVKLLPRIVRETNIVAAASHQMVVLDEPVVTRGAHDNSSGGLTIHAEAIDTFQTRSGDFEEILLSEGLNWDSMIDPDQARRIVEDRLTSVFDKQERVFSCRPMLSPHLETIGAIATDHSVA